MSKLAMSAKDFLHMDEGAAHQFSKMADLAAGGLALTFAGYLTLMFASHDWIVGANGRPLIADFLVFRVSGGLALHGKAAAAYNPYLEHVAQVDACGHDFARYLYWHYPPTFFFIAAALALIPYLPAFLSWLAATVLAYGAALSAAAKTRMAFLVGCGAPAVFISALSGQNGCLTAALMTAVLLNLEERPVLGGVFLGLLAYKPQLGVLLPVALAAGGYWRALFAAAVTLALSMAAAALAFGDQTLVAFLGDLPHASNVTLLNGANGWNNLQSVYGLMRYLGLGNTLGWTAQIVVIVSAAVGLVWVWRQSLPYALKAAALALASLIASPYLYIYDFVVLSVPLAFLYQEHPFDAPEIACIALANVCVAAFLFFPTPIGVAGAAIVAALIVRRIARAQSRETRKYSGAAMTWGFGLSRN